MFEDKDIRWIQRFDNYQKAVAQMDKFFEKKHLNPLEEQGLIQAFEYTYELAWNVMRDYLREKGFKSIIGSKDAIMQAFKEGLIDNGMQWMSMFKHRNLTSHTYNENLADEIAMAIRGIYYRLFKEFETTMKSLL